MISIVTYAMPEGRKLDGIVSLVLGLLFLKSEIQTQDPRPLRPLPVQLNKPAQLRDHHAFDAFDATRKCGAIARFVLALHVVPDLTIRALTIPTKITVRNRVN